MTILWTFIAGFLYIEISIVMMLMLPVASPRKWRQLFRSKLFDMFRNEPVVFFYGFLGVLTLFFVDAIRDMRKYSKELTYAEFDIELDVTVKLFRAQRNFYITGFAIFLAFVIRRLVTMILIQAELIEKSDKIIKQAESATAFAKTTVLKSAGDIQNYNDIKEQLECTEKLLKSEKMRSSEFEEEATKWRLKYEQVIDTKED